MSSSLVLVVSHCWLAKLHHDALSLLKRTERENMMKKLLDVEITIQLSQANSLNVKEINIIYCLVITD